MDKAAYLISGGIDSPVAAYLGIKNGWAPLFIYFDNAPFLGPAAKERAIRSMRRVAEAAGISGSGSEALIVPHGRDLELIVSRCRRNLSCMLCKRMMYRKAEAIARRHGCDAIVTGDILGEQASQTLRNLYLNLIVGLPIIRPLIGMNKLEVIEIATRIGTFEISSMKAGPCSAASIKARTRARQEELDEAEGGLPIEELVEHAVSGAERISL